MAYALLDDEWYGHRKVVELSFSARGLWVTVLAWCAHHRGTRGAVTRSVVAFLASPLLSREEALSLAGELERAELWEPCPDGWQIHDWQDWSGRRDSAPSIEVEKSDMAPTAPSTPEPDDDLTPRQRASKRANEVRWGRRSGCSPDAAPDTYGRSADVSADASGCSPDVSPDGSADVRSRGVGGSLRSDPSQNKPNREREPARTDGRTDQNRTPPERSPDTSPDAAADGPPDASGAPVRTMAPETREVLDELTREADVLPGVSIEGLARKVESKIQSAVDLGTMVARLPRRQLTAEAIEHTRRWVAEPTHVHATPKQLEAQVLAKITWLLGEYRSRKRAPPGDAAPPIGDFGSSARRIEIERQRILAEQAQGVQ